MKKIHSLTICFGLGQASFWMSFCIAVSFAAVHLKALGFSNTELGLVMAVGNIFGAICGPILASLAETRPRLSTAGLIRPLLLLRIPILVGLLLCTERSLVCAMVYAAYIAMTMAVNSLNLKYCVDASQRGLPLDYGEARAAGSLAFVLISALLGVLVRQLSYRVLIWAGLVILLLQLLANRMTSSVVLSAPVREDAAQSGKESQPLAVFLHAEPRFALFLLGAVLLFFSHNTVTNFLINLVRNVGGDEATMGAINAVMAMVEIPVMLFYSRFSKGRSVSALLRLSVAMFLAKGIAFALAPNTAALYAVNLLQAPSFALFTCAVVSYVEAVIDRQNAAKAQSLAFSVTTLGAVFASLIGGWMYDHYSVKTTLLISVAICAIGVAVCLPAIRRTEKSSL